MEEILAVTLGYLAGSVPFALLLARRRGVDLRLMGSGNVGAANVLRTSGAATAAAAMSLDVAKGAVAVLVARQLFAGPATPMAAGLAAIAGHVYPVWLGFRGGKGVATAAGVFMIFAPLAVALAAAVFALVTWITRYISVGSISAAVALMAVTAVSGAPAAVTVGAVVAAALIVHRHRANLGRVLAGTERRVGERLR